MSSTDTANEVHPAVAPDAVTHLSSSVRLPLADVFAGGEAERMTPEIAKNITVLDEPLCCFMLDDTEASMEVAALDRYLDILAAAELPGTGEQILVAIENQYGKADPDHFGRLVGWYLPETGAQMGVLIAEGFDPQLVKAVDEGRIVHPEHGIWLVEACGYRVDGRAVVHYTTRASSLPRAERIDRERAFRRGRSGASPGQAEANGRAAELFEYIAKTSNSSLAEAIRRSKITAGYYRIIEDNGNTCHVELFAGTNRISVGSCYLKATFDDDALERLVAANADTETDPTPDLRYLRSTWWHIRRDVGRDTPVGELPPHLGEEVHRALADLRPAIDIHQRALLDAASSDG